MMQKLVRTFEDLQAFLLNALGEKNSKLKDHLDSNTKTIGDLLFWLFAQIMSEDDGDSMNRRESAEMYLHGLPKMSQKRILGWLDSHYINAYHFDPKKGYSKRKLDLAEVESANVILKARLQHALGLITLQELQEIVGEDFGAEE